MGWFGKKAKRHPKRKKNNNLCTTRPALLVKTQGTSPKWFEFDLRIDLAAFLRPSGVVLSYLIGLSDGPLDALSYNPLTDCEVLYDTP